MLAIREINRENGGVLKEGMVIGSPNNNGKRTLGNMPSNYTKEIRAGLYKLLSPFQLELTSYFLSQGIKRNCTQAKSMAIVSRKDMKTHNSMLEWVYFMGGHSVLPKAPPHAGQAILRGYLCAGLSQSLGWVMHASRLLPHT